LKRLSLIGCFTCIIGLAGWSHAQATPAASRLGIAQFGGGFSVASSDCPSVPIEGLTDGCTSSSTSKGLTVYGTFDVTRHFGVEGDIHKLSLSRPGEDSYLFGPRYVFHRNRFHPYLKFQGGFGRFQTTYNTAYSYYIYAFGGGLDYHLTPHINVRAFDLEYQNWPKFPPNGISPIVGTAGVAYAF
jgi:Outer membrane protein beta-barrel domain